MGKSSASGTLQPLLEFQFQARSSELCKVRQKLRETLVSHCCPEPLVNGIVLAVGEACMNIIQHAYGAQDDGDIILEVLAKGDDLTFRLTDFARHKTCMEEMRSRSLDDLRPGGLGCHLISQIMDEVSLVECERDCGNVLQMKKCLSDK